jgi:chromate reductase
MARFTQRVFKVQMKSDSDTQTTVRTQTRLLLFPASLRQQSHQRRLIDYLARLLRGHCELDFLSAGEVNLPLFNQDLEHSPEILDSVIALHSRFDSADGLIVASPEYNGHASPYLKNTLDWVSRLPRINEKYASSNPFRNKPLLLVSASTGWTGGILGLQDARSIFSYLGSLILANQICVADADHWMDDGTYKFETAFAAHIERVISEFQSLIPSRPTAEDVIPNHGLKP